MQVVLSWLDAFWAVLADAGLWLVGGFLIAGLIQALVPRSLLTRLMGRPGMGSVFKASLIGVPIPLCSCSVIPTAAALRRGGASRGAAAAFAVSTPEVDAPSIALTWGLLGPWLAIARPITAFASAMAVGLGVDTIARKDPAPAAQPEASDPCAGGTGGGGGCGCGCSASADGSTCCDRENAANDAPKTDCCGAHEHNAGGHGADDNAYCQHASLPARRSVPAVLRATLGHGLLELPRDLSGWMVLGLAISALAMVAIPDGWIESNLGGGIVPKLVMLGIGLPWYVCATSSTPMAAALVVKGLSPGAALVFLLAGPATNPATMAWVLRDLGLRSLLVYILMVSVLALLAGIALDAIMPGAWHIPANLSDHTHGGPVALVGGIALALLLGVGLARRFVLR